MSEQPFRETVNARVQEYKRGSVYGRKERIRHTGRIRADRNKTGDLVARCWSRSLTIRVRDSLCFCHISTERARGTRARRTSSLSNSTFFFKTEDISGRDADRNYAPIHVPLPFRDRSLWLKSEEATVSLGTLFQTQLPNYNSQLATEVVLHCECQIVTFP